MELPENRTAELGVIGACLDGGLETSLLASEQLPSKCFSNDDCRFVYECIQSEASHGRATDLISILDRWKVSGLGVVFPADFYGAQDAHPKWTLQNRLETVLDMFRRRQAMLAADALLTGAERLETPLADSMAEFDEFLDKAQTNAPPILDGKATAQAVSEDLERRFGLQGALSGISTGIEGLDKITDGIQLGEVWIIGARPSVGKTALSLNIADHISLTLGIPTLFVSLEMSGLALGRRLASMRAEVNGNAIRSGQFTENDFKRLTTFSAKLAASPLKILDSPGGIRINQLCHSIRAAIKRWGIKVVFLDYIQKIRPDSKGEKRTYEIGDTSAQLVELVKRENVNLFALAQLNRESEKERGREPRLSDLADSKSIEADADFVGLLNRPIDGDERKAHLRVAKQRDGERGVIPLVYHGWHCRFRMGDWKTNENE